VGQDLRLTKHHGSGNDFLVLLDSEDGPGPDPEEISALCDRHRGIGADGLIVGRPGSDGADLLMELTNADGSAAEMSGNGIRCLVQAAVAAGIVSDGKTIVDTVGGRRTVRYSTTGEGVGFADVDMGPALVSDDLGPEQLKVLGAPAEIVSRACFVDVGNPHVVLLAEAATVDLIIVGPTVDSSVEGGANVEVVRPVDATGPEPASGALDLEVWERGVGMTESCGTGACAAAAAARRWSLTGDDVEVRTSGGVLKVRLEPDNVILAGPAHMIGKIHVDRDTLSSLVEERRDWLSRAL
jgi:diaminopimelate epimerase